MEKTALITGASSAIGQATAYLLAEEGYDLILSAKRAQNIRELQHRIELKFPEIEIIALSFDIRDKQQCEASLNSVPENFRDIDLLINNASVSLDFTKIDQGEPNDWDTMIDTNVKGLLYISRIVAKKMVERKKGHIINIGSEVAQNSGAVYTSAHYAVRALSEAMRADLKEHGIRVTEIRTELNSQTLEPDDVAEAIAWAAEQPSHVSINLIEIMPTNNKNQE